MTFGGSYNEVSGFLLDHPKVKPTKGQAPLEYTEWTTLMWKSFDIWEMSPSWKADTKTKEFWEKRDDVGR